MENETKVVTWVMYSCQEHYILCHPSSVIANEEKDDRSTNREEILLHFVLSNQTLLLQPPLWPEDISVLSIDGSVGVSDPGVNSNHCLRKNIKVSFQTHSL